MPPASLLIKPVSGRCNLACTYCFYRDVASHRHTRDFGRMTQDTLRALVKGALEYAEGSVGFAFQGGEPTLAGLDFYRTFVETVEELNVAKVSVAYMLQTNGMVIDDEWAAFLAEKHFLTGLSMDGPRVLHDRSRIRVDGSGSFAGVLQAANRLRAHQAEFNILCVVNKDIASNPVLVYEFFKKKDFRWIQYIPCLDPLDPGERGAGPEKNDENGLAGKDAGSAGQKLLRDPAGAGETSGPESGYLDENDYSSFLKTTFDLWERDLRSGHGVSIRYFDNLVDMAMGYPPENCGMSGRCGAYFTIEADGSVYPCDFYVLDEWLMGNVRSDSFAAMADSDAAREFVKSSLPVSPECTACFAWPLCRGGCRRDREPFIDGSPHLNRHCSAFRDFFSYAGQRIVNIAKEYTKAKSGREGRTQ